MSRFPSGISEAIWTIRLKFGRQVWSYEKTSPFKFDPNTICRYQENAKKLVFLDVFKPNLRKCLFWAARQLRPFHRSPPNYTALLAPTWRRMFSTFRPIELAVAMATAKNLLFFGHFSATQSFGAIFFKTKIDIKNLAREKLRMLVLSRKHTSIALCIETPGTSSIWRGAGLSRFCRK